MSKLGIFVNRQTLSSSEQITAVIKCRDVAESMGHTVEFIFPEGESFKHYNLKWIDYDKMTVVTLEEPAPAHLSASSAPLANMPSRAAGENLFTVTNGSLGKITGSSVLRRSMARSRSRSPRLLST